MVRRDRRWLWLTLAVSAGLHALVLVTLSDVRPAPVKTPRALEVDVRWLERSAPSSPAPAAAAPQPAARTGPKTSRRVAVPATPTTAEPSTGGAVGETALESDVPLVTGPGLTPGLGVVLEMPEAADAEPPRGVTLHNTVMDQPDAVAVAEYVGEVLTRRLNADLARDVASAANAVGTVPRFFRRAESSLKDEVALAPPAHAARDPLAVARDVVKTALSPGISDEAAKQVLKTPLGHSVMMKSVPLPNIEDQRFRESALQMLAVSEAIKERARAVRLRTVLELTTDASGAVADVSVLEKSGDTTFDESAIHLSRRVLRELPDDDDKGLGTSWWRSRWQFTWEPPFVRVRLLEARPLER